MVEGEPGLPMPPKLPPKQASANSLLRFRRFNSATSQGRITTAMNPSDGPRKRHWRKTYPGVQFNELMYAIGTLRKALLGEEYCKEVATTFDTVKQRTLQQHAVGVCSAWPKQHGVLYTPTMPMARANNEINDKSASFIGKAASAARSEQEVVSTSEGCTAAAPASEDSTTGSAKMVIGTPADLMIAMMMTAEDASRAGSSANAADWQEMLDWISSADGHEVEDERARSRLGGARGQ